MVTFETTIKDKKVKMYADVPLKNAAGAIFQTLANISTKTNIFSEKFIMSFGWAYFFMSKREDENKEEFWVVQTTDYKKNPMQDRTDNVTVSLLVQNMQVEGIKVAGLKPENCTFKDTILVLKKAVNQEDIYLSRTEAANKGDSGWYFGLLNDPDEDKHTSDEYEKVPTYQLLNFRSEALRVLQMPVGTVAVIHKNELTALVDKDDKPLKFTTEQERQKILAERKKEEEAAAAEKKDN